MAVLFSHTTANTTLLSHCFNSKNGVKMVGCKSGVFASLDNGNCFNKPDKSLNASHFTGVEVMDAPPPIVGVSQAFPVDTIDHTKLNLGIANYELIQPEYNYVFNVVKKAEKLILEKGEDKEYLPVEGLSEFNKATAQLLLGAENPLLKQFKVASVQCCGGTGSLRLGAAFIQRFFPTAKVLLSPPTWGDHKDIFNEARVPWSEYRYCDPKTMELDFEGMIADIKAAPNGSFILLQGCAHNPTCIDPTLQQWEKIADVIQHKNHVPFFDVAYQGVASGNLDADVAPVRMFCRRGMDVIVAQSYSKNLGLYAERIGALNLICSSPHTVTKVKSQLKWLIVGMYAFPPVHGARIVATIAREPDLFDEWKEEIASMAARIKSARRKLYRSLTDKEKCNKDWSFILDQLGIFSYTGLNKAQIEYMERKWHVKVTEDGRLPLAGISSAICEYVADAIIDSFKNS